MMTTVQQTHHQKIQKQARLAGLWYFVLLLTAPIGLMYVPSQVIVRGNATATADNLRASEDLFRIGIGSELVHQVIMIFLVLALYRLFRPVDEDLAKQLVILGSLVATPIVFVNVLNEIAALWLAQGADFLQVFDAAQRDALSYFFLRLHGQGITVVSVFWGLWLFPFARLVFRSGFIPRVFGALLLIAGSTYVVSSFVKLVIPRWQSWIDPFTTPLMMTEIPIIFWLLIWGARKKR
jgi:Domain of unknown function (DUF4386)